MSTFVCKTCTFLNKVRATKCEMCDTQLKVEQSKKGIACPSCTFLNKVRATKCEMCSTALIMEVVDCKEMLCNALETDEAAEATSGLVKTLQEKLGVTIALTVLHGDFKNPITKKGDIKLTLVQTGLRYGHYLLRFQGKVLDMGQYNTDPRGLNGLLRKQYDTILKKNGWTKKCNNCCLPMCIIVGVLLSQHYKENPRSNVLSRLCATQARLMEEEEKLRQESVRAAEEFKRKAEETKRLREEEEKEGLRFALQLQQEEERARRQRRGAPPQQVHVPQQNQSRRQQDIDTKAVQLAGQLVGEEEFFKPHMRKIHLPGSGYELVKQLDAKEGAVLLCTSRFGPFVVKWDLTGGKWVVAHHRFQSDPKDFRVDSDKSYHLYFTWQDSRVFRRR